MLPDFMAGDLERRIWRVGQAESKQCVVKGGVGSQPATCPQLMPVANAYAFRAGYLEAARLESLLTVSPPNLLGIVLHDRGHRELRGVAAAPSVCLDLPQFHGAPLAEVWTSTLPVTYHRTEGIRYAMNDDVIFGAMELEETPDTLLDTLTYAAYRRLLVQTSNLGYPHLLRVWNYFPRINLKLNGMERYQRFCAGRHQALAECRTDFHRVLPAATAIGTMSGPLQIHFLAGRRPGTHVENPRQVSAYHYPRMYSPESPSFARATLRPSNSGSHLLISGTASVVGHVSEHIGEPRKQTVEIVHNLNALIMHTEQLHGIARGQWCGQALFKIYIRHPAHYPLVRDILNDQLPAHTQVQYLQGDMCRSELLVEVEGILSQDTTIDASHRVSPARTRVSQPAASQHAQLSHVKIV